MKRLTLVLAAALAIVPFAARGAHAQPSREACPYDTCSLRIRAATFTRPPALVRGRDETEVVTLTPFGYAVAPFFERSDSAYALAQRYDRLTPAAAVLNMTGTALAILSPLLVDFSDRPFLSLTLFSSGVGMSIYGSHLANTASDALNRAIWWHNR